MSDQADLTQLWQATGSRVVRGRWTSAGTMTADRAAVGGAPAALASERVLAQERGHGAFEPSCMAFLVDDEVAAQLDAPALAAHVAALDAPPAPQLLRAVAGEARRVVFLTDNGSNLAFRLQEWRFLGWEEACRVLAEVARALVAAHAAGLTAGHLEPHHVHMGPENAVLLALPGAQVALVARRIGLATAGADLLVAPELLAGGAPTPASDVYGLAALFLHLVCGRAPVPTDVADARDGASLEALAFKIRGREFDLPRRVLDLIAQMLHPDPARRPPAAQLPELIVAVSTGQLTQAVRLIHGDTDKVDPATGVPLEALRAPVVKPGLLGRLTQAVSSADELPARSGGVARAVPPPPGAPPAPTPDPGFWEGTASRPGLSPAELAASDAEAASRPLPTAAELRAQVQRQLKEDAQVTAPAAAPIDVGQLPPGADRAAAEAFLRSMQAPPAAPRSRARPPRARGLGPARTIALLTIFAIFGYMFVRAKLPQIIDAVIPAASIH